MKKEIILEKDVKLPIKQIIEVYNLGTESNPSYVLTEKTARYRLSTHKNCENCGSVMSKTSYCQSCYSKKQSEKYIQKPFKEWDGETPLVIYNSDIYFFDEEDIQNYLEEKDDDDDLELMICEPIYVSQIDETYFLENLSENIKTLDDFDKDLAEKIKKLNEYIKTLKPIGWLEGKFKTQYKNEIR